MSGLKLVILALAVASFPAWAQVSASISGRVEDPSGAGIAGAAITAKSIETGAIRKSVTDSSGNYELLLSLPVGPQELKAEMVGFKAVVRTGIDLEVGQQAVANLRLEVGELVQQVNVVEGALSRQHHDRVGRRCGERTRSQRPAVERAQFR